MGCSWDRPSLLFNAVGPAPADSDDGNEQRSIYRGGSSGVKSNISWFGMKSRQKTGAVGPLPIFQKSSIHQSQVLVHNNGRFSPEIIDVGHNHDQDVDGNNRRPSGVPISRSFTLSLPAAAAANWTPDGNPANTDTTRPAVDAYDATAHVTDESGLQYRDKVINPTNMISAVKRGDFEGVRQLAQVESTPGQRSIVNALGMWRSSPLMTAVQYGHLSIANFLLDHPKVDVSHANEKGVTAMLLACADGHTDLVGRLLQRGAPPAPPPVASFYNPAVDKSGPATPFSIACANGHARCVSALVLAPAGGVRVNALFEFGLPFKGGPPRFMSPLQVACQHKQLEVVRTLLGLNADCSLVDDTNASVLTYAALAVRSQCFFFPSRCAVRSQWSFFLVVLWVDMAAVAVSVLPSPSPSLSHCHTATLSYCRTVTLPGCHCRLSYLSHTSDLAPLRPLILHISPSHFTLTFHPHISPSHFTLAIHPLPPNPS